MEVIVVGEVALYVVPVSLDDVEDSSSFPSALTSAT
jgi:hypothetical protein